MTYFSGGITQQGLTIGTADLMSRRRRVRVIKTELLDYLLTSYQTPRLPTW